MRHSMYMGDFGDDSEGPGGDRAFTSNATFTADTSSLELQESMYGSGATQVTSPPLVAQNVPSTSDSGFLTGLTSGITSFFGPARTAPKTPVAQTGMPSWVLPVVLGVGGLAVVALVMSSRRPAMGRYKRRSRR